MTFSANVLLTGPIITLSLSPKYHFALWLNWSLWAIRSSLHKHVMPSVRFKLRGRFLPVDVTMRKLVDGRWSFTTFSLSSVISAFPDISHPVCPRCTKKWLRNHPCIDSHPRFDSKALIIYWLDFVYPVQTSPVKEVVIRKTVWVEISEERDDVMFWFQVSVYICLSCI